MCCLCGNDLCQGCNVRRVSAAMGMEPDPRRARLSARVLKGDWGQWDSFCLLLTPGAGRVPTTDPSPAFPCPAAPSLLSQPRPAFILGKDGRMRPPCGLDGAHFIAAQAPTPLPLTGPCSHWKTQTLLPLRGSSTGSAVAAGPIPAALPRMCFGSCSVPSSLSQRDGCSQPPTHRCSRSPKSSPCSSFASQA